ncbi:MAG: LysO family transporter [Peptostreptococcaceae bacterium]|nr:LysO family transporter [Peptostreptococcaceae bacterium]
MEKIIIFFGLGIIIGLFQLIPKQYMKFNSKLQTISLIILIFGMGTSIGGDEKILKSLNEVGLKAFAFAILSIIFSIIILFIFSKLFKLENSNIKEERDA